MSAVENLLRTALKVSGIDIEEVKADVTKRVAAFEQNVETLNNTLISQHQRLATIETNLEKLFAFHNIEYTKAATPKDQNDARGSAVSALSGPAKVA